MSPSASRWTRRFVNCPAPSSKSPVSIVITNKDGNIEYVNQKFTEVTGYSFSEAMGKNPRILKSGELPAEVYKRMWECISNGQEWRGEFHNRKRTVNFFGSCP